MDDDTPMLFSPKQASRMLGVSRSTLYVLMQKGQLSSILVGRSRKFTTRHIEDFIADLSQQ
jgi:excisionase family DNA binding protein